MKWKCRDSHCNWTLMLRGTATLWVHTASGGTILHLTLLNRLHVVWEVNRIMILKTNSGSQEARKTQHQHAKEPKKGLAIFRNSWVSFPLHNSLKLHHSTIGPRATKTAPWHFALSRVLHISQSLSLSPSHPRECCFHLDREKKCSLNCKDGITPPLNMPVAHSI